VDAQEMMNVYMTRGDSLCCMLLQISCAFNQDQVTAQINAHNRSAVFE
jgi:hypothetical protein